MLVLQLNTSLVYSLLFVLHTLCGFKSTSKSSCNAFRIFFTVICSKSATPRIAWTLVSITLWVLSSFYLSLFLLCLCFSFSLSLSLFHSLSFSLMLLVYFVYHNKPTEVCLPNWFTQFNPILFTYIYCRQVLFRLILTHCL